MLQGRISQGEFFLTRLVLNVIIREVFVVKHCGCKCGFFLTEEPYLVLRKMLSRVLACCFCVSELPR